MTNNDSGESEMAPGDVVSLLSGGHQMTIGAIEESFAHCYWAVRGKVNSDILPTRILKNSAEIRHLVVMGDMEDEDKEIIKKTFEIEKIQERDVVILRSGSFPMTVQSLNTKYAECIWSDGAVMKTKTIHLAALKKQRDGANLALMVGSLTR